MLKISSQLLKTEAEARGWTVQIIDEDKAILEYTIPGRKPFLMYSLNGPLTSHIGSKISNDKPLLFASVAQLPVNLPKTSNVYELSEALPLLKDIGTLVVKPTDAAHGNGVTTNIDTEQKLEKAFALAKEYSDQVIVQEQLEGQDYRLLVIGGKLAAASIRIPAFVVGDGVHTIKELIGLENASGERAPDYQKPKNLIDVEGAIRYLGDSIETVPAKDEEVRVVGTANIGTGGVSIEVTDQVPPEMADLAISILDRISLQTGAVDFYGSFDKYWLLEVNSNPSLGFHLKPAEGEGRPVHKMFIDWLADNV